MSDKVLLLTNYDVPESPARVHAPRRPRYRVALVQERWRPDAEAHRAALATGVRMAAAEGAQLVCLQELTLSPYFAITEGGPEAVGAEPEPLPGGPTHEFATQLARENRVTVHASLYGRAEEVGLGYNTAIAVAPDGSLLARTRKTHLPVTAGYYEDK